MDRSLPLFLIGIVFGGGLGYAIAAASGASFEPHDHSNPAHHMGGMDHGADHGEPLDVSGPDAPRLSLRLHPDPKSGYNVELLTENFAFSPLNASGENVPGEGHAHVYVNGVKLGRVYGNWLHLEALPKGEVEIMVSLNANDHSPLAVDGVPVTASEILTVE
jgi:hypothetical protein